MKIAVLGGGNGAAAAAADLTEKGHEVRWWRRNAAALLPRLTLKDADGERVVALTPCPDIGEAVGGAELVFMPDPAFTQEDNAARLAPHLADDQVVFLAPGTFGSYVMASRIRKGVFAETGTLPWLTRKHGPEAVAITTRATRLPSGVFPASRSKEALERIRQL
ncbi:MAG: glycerol-3-phosphate dehydrogenase, partial [Burkholderiales bacterium]|nr:glycerol-3-phosphate dehydrogenase [Burkholderiales bacterium]